MMYLSALLPAREGVGVLAALREDAATLVAAGDGRTRDQIMADTLVARVTGREPATGSRPVVIDVVITDAALFDAAWTGEPAERAEGAGTGEPAVEEAAVKTAGAEESAFLDGYGPVPAELIREIASETLAEGSDTVYLRRLHSHPATRDLVAMESRHIDHVVPHVDGGPTSVANGQGLCAACNHAKQAPGRRSRPSPGPEPGGRHTVITTTPTGHAYTGTAPRLAS